MAIMKGKECEADRGSGHLRLAAREEAPRVAGRDGNIQKDQALKLCDRQEKGGGILSKEALEPASVLSSLLSS